jgi:CIC family chloride channel protein
MVNRILGHLVRNFEFFIRWSQNRLSRKQFIFLSSILIGLSAGFAAIVLKTTVHYIFLIATYEKLSQYRFFYLLLPVIGLFLTVLVSKRLLKKKLEKGLSQIHYAIAKKSSILPKNQMYDQVVTSSITVGLGGSTGLEAPIVITGAAFGSNFARKYHLTSKERTLMLACGIAAGIGAAFNAPIAGVLFALEVLLLDISITAFTPLIISAATGALISKIILNDNILLSFQLTESFNYKNVPFYVILGVFAGLVSVYHSRTFLKVESLFHKTPGAEYRKVIVGGLILAALIFIFPTLFGEGYQSIKWLALQRPEAILDNSLFQRFRSNEGVVLLFVGLLVFFKSIATGLTLGSGGNGGNFAPALFTGAYLGYFFSKSLNWLSLTKLPENNFTIVGMAGILSGLYHAPLTAIFLIAEITGGYTLMIPLMIVSSISFAISKYFEPFSMDTKKIASTGDVLTSDRDKNVLSAISTSEFIETNYPVIKPNLTLGKLVHVVSNSTRNIFPVTNDNDDLIGVIWLDDIRDVMFKNDLYDIVCVKDLMVKPMAVIEENEPMEDVMGKFDYTGSWILPVVKTGTRKYIGFVSKSNIFTGYRSKLKVITIE